MSVRSVLAVVAATCLAGCGLLGGAESAGLSQEEFAALNKTGAHHEHLSPMVGRFKAEVSFWPEEGAAPFTMSGTMENQWILGGRYLQSRFKSGMGDQSFEGFGLMGYDTFQDRYQGTWIDTDSIFMKPVSTGHCSQGGKVIELEREFVHPMRGTVHARDVTTVRDRSRHTFELFESSAREGERRILQVVYTRL